MKHPSIEDIKKCYRMWEAQTASSKQESDEVVSFIQEQQQWSDKVKKLREKNGDECLQINLVQKFIASVKARPRNIELVTGQVPLQAEPSENSEEQRKVFKLLFDELTLNQENKGVFDQGFSQTCDFGMSAYYVEPDYISSSSLNCVPRVKLIPPHADIYFDTSSTNRTKNNGSQAGFRMQTKASTLRSAYPNSSFGKNKDSNSDVTVYSHFYKVYEREEYFPVDSTGEYKLKEAFLDSENIDKNKKTKSREVSNIYFCRVADSGEGEYLESPKKYPITPGFDLLPIVYNYGRSSFIPNRVIFSPLGSELIDSQRYLNYLVSQTASIAKTTTGDKIFGGPEHVIDDEDAITLSDINKRAGWITLGAAPKDILHIPSAQLPQTLLSGAESAKQMIQEVGGAFINSEAMKVSGVSGVAFDKMFRHQDMLQDPLILAHIDSVNNCSQIVKNMLPYVVTEQRVLYVKKDDTSIDPIVINEYKKGTLTLKNNIKDICNIYDYKVSASVTDDLEKQNAAELALDLMKINPNFVQVLSGILVDCFPNSYRDDIVKRIRAAQDPEFIRYIDGDMTLKQYQESSQQKNAQKEKSMLDMQQFAAKKAEKELEIKQFEAESKRIDVASKAQTAEKKVSIEKASALTDMHLKEHEISTGIVKEEIIHAKALLDATKKEGI